MSDTGASKSKSKSLGGLTVYLYVAVMTALFAQQAARFLRKYRDHKIVEETRTVDHEVARMPQLTFCTIPPYAKDVTLQEVMLFETFCPREDGEDPKACIERQR